MKNRYRFEYRYLNRDDSFSWGCYVDAHTPAEAWELFEATHPPSRYVVNKVRLFSDGTTNRLAS